jgi:hypothetical protein
MASVDEAVQKQQRNIESRTGRPFDAWVELARSSGMAKHGQILAWLKTEHGFGHGDANLVALTALRGPDAPEGRLAARGLRPRLSGYAVRWAGSSVVRAGDF